MSAKTRVIDLVDNSRIYLTSLLFLSGISLIGIYLISYFYTSLFSETIVHIVLSICSLTLFITILSFSSTEVIRNIDDTRTWRNIRIAVLVLCSVIMVISAEYAVNLNSGLTIEPEYTPYISLALIVILLILADKILGMFYDVPEYRMDREKRFESVSRICSSNLENLMDDRFIKDIVNRYKKGEDRFLIEQDIQGELTKLVEASNKDELDFMSNDSEYTIEKFESEIRRNIQDISKTLVSEYGSSFENKLKNNEKNIKRLSKRIVYLGELKEYRDDDIDKYIDDLMKIIEINYSKNNPINPTKIEKSLRQVSVEKRYELYSLVDMEVRIITENSGNSDEKELQYVEKIRQLDTL